MNIDVSGVYQTRFSPVPSTHAIRSDIGSVYPGGSRCRNSPGMSPSSHTDFDSAGSAPIPCTNTHIATFARMSANVASGVASVGLSSRYGNMADPVTHGRSGAPAHHGRDED